MQFNFQGREYQSEIQSSPILSVKFAHTSLQVLDVVTHCISSLRLFWTNF